MEKIRYRLVYNRRKQLNNAGTALIQVETLLQKRKMYFSTNIYVKPEQWDKGTSMVKNHPHYKELNTFIYEFILHLESIELGLWKRGVIPTLTLLKDAIRNKRAPEITFTSFCISVIENSNRTTSTKANLKSTLKILADFRVGYTWNDISYTFLKDFEIWLLNKGAAVNTVGKHLRNFRTLINEGIAAGYISSDANPFRNYRITQEKVPHRFLTPDELKKMENVKVVGKMKHIRDAFLFCCYTGLRFSDFVRLKDEYIVKDCGNRWINMKTQKTNYDLRIPLSLLFDGKAEKIIMQYSSLSRFAHIGCNADTNKRLRYIQQKAKIKTRITFHTARHTCATLLCHQGVPITTVQKLLGHTKITTTQIYSEVMNDTIIKDLKKAQKSIKKQHSNSIQ